MSKSLVQNIQLIISRPRINDLFKGLLEQILFSSKYKENAEREFAPIYFNSTTKIVIGFEDSLHDPFLKIFNRIDNCISEGYGWMIESVDGEYVSVSTYSP